MRHRSRSVAPILVTFVMLTAVIAAVPAGAAARARSANSAAPGTAVSGRCSRATATALFLQLHLGEPSHPVAQVLCGHFVGPRSNAMVASVSTPGCGASIGWLVFRRAAGAWRTMLETTNGADLDAVGTNIRETHFLLRPGDPHCIPTGGTVSRIWHWNGRRFTHTAYRRSGAMFVSPSRNLWCVISIRMTRCQSSQLPHTARLSTRGAMTTCNGPTCLLPGSQPPNAAVLPYGRALSVGAFRCGSQPTGMTCTLRRSARGFTINSAGVTRV